MSATTTLSFKSIATVGLQPAGLFGVGSALLLGSTFWHSFIGGPVAFTSIPREHFRAIQSKIFPILFASQVGISTALLGLWLRLHPRVSSFDGFLDISSPDSLTAVSLTLMALTGAANLLAIGPMATKVMHQRVAKEAAEGKSYNDPAASNELKSLTSQFSRLHGISSLLNLFFLGGSLLSTSLTAVYGVVA